MLNPNISQTCSSDYKFTGYEYDSETGLYYAKARYYNPRLGRFMSTDPLDGSSADPQSWNHYAFVLNNTENLIDPLGLQDTSTTVYLAGDCLYSYQTSYSIDSNGNLEVTAGHSTLLFCDADMMMGSATQYPSEEDFVFSMEAKAQIAQALLQNRPQTVLQAVAQGTQLAGHALPAPCGAGVFGYAGGHNSYGLVQYDSGSGVSAGVLFEGQGVGFAGTAANSGIHGEGLVFVGEEAGGFTTVSQTPSVGPFFGVDVPGTSIAAGLGAYVTIGSAAGCS